MGQKGRHQIGHVAKRRENGAMITLQRSHRGKMMITLQRPHRGTYREAVAGSDLFGGVSNKSKADADIGTCVGQSRVGESCLVRVITSKKVEKKCQVGLDTLDPMEFFS